jgi:hypothetical protein
MDVALMGYRSGCASTGYGALWGCASTGYVRGAHGRGSPWAWWRQHDRSCAQTAALSGLLQVIACELRKHKDVSCADI